MNRFMRRYPSPSLIVSIIALVIALGGAGYSATGGNFILGVNSNTAATQTGLVSNRNGRALAIQNTNTGAAATALSLAVAAGHPPFVTNSTTKVPNLNADRLDGLDSTQLTRRRTLPFTIGGGAITAPIAVPANQLVYLMGAATGPTTPGVGMVTMFRFPGDGIMWTGLHHNGGDAFITTNISGGTGTRIMGLDLAGELWVEVSGPDAIRLNNTGADARTGVLTFLW